MEWKKVSTSTQNNQKTKRAKHVGCLIHHFSLPKQVYDCYKAIDGSRTSDPIYQEESITTSTGTSINTIPIGDGGGGTDGAGDGGDSSHGDCVLDKRISIEDKQSHVGIKKKKRISPFITFGGANNEGVVDEFLKVTISSDDADGFSASFSPHIFGGAKYPSARKGATFVVVYPNNSSLTGTSSRKKKSVHYSSFVSKIEEELFASVASAYHQQVMDHQKSAKSSFSKNNTSRLAEAATLYCDDDDDDDKVTLCTVVMFGGENKKYHMDDLWFLHIKKSSLLSNSSTNSLDQLLEEHEKGDISLDDLYFEWEEILPNSSKNPGPRSDHVACLYEKEEQQFMVIFGGNNGSFCLDDLWILDMHTLMWEQVPRNSIWPSGRCHHTASIVDLSDLTRKINDHHMFVFFGEKLANSLPLEQYNDCWSFDFQRRTWSKRNFNSQDSFKHRFGHSCNYIGRGCFFLFGGSSVIETFSDAYIVDILNNKWEPIPNTSSLDKLWPDARRNHLALYDPLTRMLIIHGGYSKLNSRNHDLWMINADTILMMSGLGRNIHKILSPRKKADLLRFRKKKQKMSDKVELLNHISKLGKTIEKKHTLSTIIERYNCYIELTMYDKALLDIHTCLLIDKENKERHVVNQGICLYKMQKYLDVITVTSTAISSLEPNISNNQSKKILYVNALKIRAKSYFYLHRFDYSLKDAEKVLEIYSLNDDSVGNLPTKSSISSAEELKVCISCMKSKLDSLCLNYQYDAALSCFIHFQLFVENELKKSSHLFATSHKHKKYLESQSIKLKIVKNSICSSKKKHNRNLKRMKKVQQLKKQNNFPKAIHKLYKIIKNDERSDVHLPELADCYFANQEYEKSMKVVLLMIDIDPENIDAYIKMGDIHSHNRMIPKARLYYNKAMTICNLHTNDNISFHQKLETIKQKLIVAEDREKIILEAMELAKTGFEYMQVKQFAESIKFLTNAIEKDPYFRFFIDRSKSYYELNDIPNAMRDVELALRYYPLEALPYVTLATYFTNFHLYSKALMVTKYAMSVRGIDDKDLETLHKKILEINYKKKSTTKDLLMIEKQIYDLEDVFIPVEKLPVHFTPSKTLTIYQKTQVSKILKRLRKVIKTYSTIKALVLKCRIEYELCDFSSCIDTALEIMRFPHSPDININLPWINHNEPMNSERKHKTTLLLYDATLISAKAYLSMSRPEDAYKMIDMFQRGVVLDQQSYQKCCENLRDFSKQIESEMKKKYQIIELITQGHEFMENQSYQKAANTFSKIISAYNKTFWFQNPLFSSILFDYAESLFMTKSYNESFEILSQIQQKYSYPFFDTLRISNLIKLQEGKDGQEDKTILWACEKILNELTPCNRPLNSIYLKLKWIETEIATREKFEKCRQMLGTHPKETKRLISEYIHYHPFDINARLIRSSINLNLKNLHHVLDDCLFIEKEIRTIAESQYEMKVNQRGVKEISVSGFLNHLQSIFQSPSMKKSSETNFNIFEILASSMHMAGRASLMMGRFDDAKRYGNLSMKFSFNDESASLLVKTVDGILKGDAHEYFTQSSQVKNVRYRDYSMLKLISQAINKYSNNPLYYTERAKILVKLHMYDDALGDINSALELNTDDIEAYILQSSIFLVRHEFEKAQDSLIISKNLVQTIAHLKNVYSDKISELEENLKEYSLGCEKAKKILDDVEKLLPETKNFDQISRTFFDAVVLVPNNMEYITKYINILLKVDGNHRYLANSCRLLLEMFPTTPSCYTFVADLSLNQTQNYDESLFTIISGLELIGPNDLNLLKVLYNLIQCKIKELDSLLDEHPVLERSTFTDNDDQTLCRTFVLLPKEGNIINLASVVGTDITSMLDSLSIDDINQSTPSSNSPDPDKHPFMPEGISNKNNKLEEVQKFVQHTLAISAFQLKPSEKDYLLKLFGSSFEVKEEPSLPAKSQVFSSRLTTLCTNSHYFYTPQSFFSEKNYEVWKEYEMKKLQDVSHSLKFEETNSLGKPLKSDYEQKLKMLMEAILHDPTTVNTNILKIVYHIANWYGIGEIKADLLLLQYISKWQRFQMFSNVYLVTKVLASLVIHIIERSTILSSTSTQDFKSSIPLFLSKTETILFNSARENIDMEYIFSKHYRALVSSEKEIKKCQKAIKTGIKAMYFMKVIEVFTGCCSYLSSVPLREKLLLCIQENHEIVAQLFKQQIISSLDPSSSWSCNYLNVLCESMKKYVKNYLLFFGDGSVFPISIGNHIIEITKKFLYNYFTKEIEVSMTNAKQILNSNDVVEVDFKAFNIPNALSDMIDAVYHSGCVFMISKTKVEHLLLPYIRLYLRNIGQSSKEWCKNSLHQDSWKRISTNVFHTSSVVDIFVKIRETYEFTVHQCKFFTTEPPLAFEQDETAEIMSERASILKQIYEDLGNTIRTILVNYCNLQQETFENYLKKYCESIHTNAESSNSEDAGSEEMFRKLCAALSNIIFGLECLKGLIAECIATKDPNYKIYIDYPAQMKLKSNLTESYELIKSNYCCGMANYLIEMMLKKCIQSCFEGLKVIATGRNPQPVVHISQLFVHVDSFLNHVKPFVHESYGLGLILEQLFDFITFQMKEFLIPEIKEDEQQTVKQCEVWQFDNFITQINREIISYFLGSNPANEMGLLAKSADYIYQELFEIHFIADYCTKPTTELVRNHLFLSGRNDNMQEIQSKIFSSAGTPSKIKSVEDVNKEIYRKIQSLYTDSISSGFSKCKLEKNVIEKYILGIIHQRGFSNHEDAARKFLESEFQIVQSSHDQYDSYWNLMESEIEKLKAHCAILNDHIQLLTTECDKILDTYDVLKEMSQQYKGRLQLRMKNRELTKDLNRSEALLGQIEEQITFHDKMLGQQLDYINHNLAVPIPIADQLSTFTNILYHMYEWSTAIKKFELIEYQKCAYDFVPGYLCIANAINFDDSSIPNLVFIPYYKIECMINPSSTLSSQLFPSQTQVTSGKIPFAFCLDGDRISWVKPHKSTKHSMMNGIEVRKIKFPKESSESYRNLRPKYYIFHSFENEARRDIFVEKVQIHIISKRTQNHHKIWVTRAVHIMQQKLRNLLVGKVLEQATISPPMTPLTPSSPTNALYSYIKGYPISSLLLAKFKTKSFALNLQDRLLRKFSLHDAYSHFPGTLYIFTSAICFENHLNISQNYKVVVPLDRLCKMSKIVKSYKSKMNSHIILTDNDGKKFIFYASSIQERDLVFDNIESAARRVFTLVTPPIISTLDERKEIVIVFSNPT